MNWFKRYGIIGMSFWIFFLVLYWIFFSEKIDFSSNIDTLSNDILIAVIGKVVIFTFLPVGYFIATMSMNLYYVISKFSKKGVHQKILRKMTIDNVDFAKNNVGLTAEDSEAKIEAVLTYLDRYKSEKSDRIETVGPFITKRFDVIAINNAIIFGAVGAFVINIILVIPKVHWLLIFLVFSILCIIIALLLCANNRLKQQIVKIQELMFTDIAKDE